MKKGLIACLCMLLLVAGSMVSMGYVQAGSEDTIYDGVSIDGMDVSGMTKQQAEDAFDAYMEKLMEAKVSFCAYGKNYDISLEDGGLLFDGSDLVETAYAYGRKGNMLARYKEIVTIAKTPVDISLSKEINSADFEEKLKDMTNALNVEPKNASLVKQNGKLVVVEEEVGKEVDYDATMQKMLDAMADGWHGEDITVDMQIKEAQPKYTTSDFDQVKDVLGTFSTKYSGTKDRELNLINGCKKINGSVLFPGEVFSVYDAASPFNTANGYHAANQYLNGEVVSGVGGGICQVSTTLYNAVLCAELEVTQRAPHSMVVSYVPRSADAAIAGTYKDLKFKNNTDAPIYIEAGAGGGTVTFTIYGHETRSSNRTIKFESKTISTKEAGDPIETVDKTKPAGYRHVTQGAHTGYKAELWKYVYVDGKQTESVKVNTSTYNASPARVTVGPEKDEDTDTTESDSKKDSSDKKDKKTKTDKTDKNKKSDKTNEAATQAPAEDSQPED